MKKQKNIYLTTETIDKAGEMAERDAHSVKFFIERQVTIMCDKGVSYLDLWERSETTAKKLKELSKLK